MNRPAACYFRIANDQEISTVFAEAIRSANEHCEAIYSSISGVQERCHRVGLGIQNRKVTIDRLESIMKELEIPKECENIAVINDAGSITVTINQEFQRQVLMADKVAITAEGYMLDGMLAAEEILQRTQYILQTACISIEAYFSAQIGELGTKFQSISLLQHNGLVPFAPLYWALCRWDRERAASFRTAYITAAQSFYYKAFQQTMAQFAWSKLLPMDPTPLIGSAKSNRTVHKATAPVAEEETGLTIKESEFGIALAAVARVLLDFVNSEVQFAESFLRISPHTMVAYIRDVFGRSAGSYARQMQAKLLVAANLSEIASILAEIRSFIGTFSVTSSPIDHHKQSSSCYGHGGVAALLENTVCRMLLHRIALLLQTQQQSLDSFRIDNKTPPVSHVSIMIVTRRLATFFRRSVFASSRSKALAPILSIPTLDMDYDDEEENEDSSSDSNVRISLMGLIEAYDRLLLRTSQHARLDSIKSAAFAINNYEHLISELHECDASSNPSLLAQLLCLFEQRLNASMVIFARADVEEPLEKMFDIVNNTMDASSLDESLVHEAVDQINVKLQLVLEGIRTRFLQDNTLFCNQETKRLVLDLVIGRLIAAFTAFVEIHDDAIGKQRSGSRLLIQSRAASAQSRSNASMPDGSLFHSVDLSESTDDCAMSASEESDQPLLTVGELETLIKRLGIS